MLFVVNTALNKFYLILSYLILSPTVKSIAFKRDATVAKSTCCLFPLSLNAPELNQYQTDAASKWVIPV